MCQQHGNGVTFGEYGEYEDEVQRHGRHVTDGGRENNKLRSRVVTAAAASTPAYKTSTSSGFGPSKSVGLAATLILLAFICIFTMGLKTWYHKRRKDQKEKEEVQGNSDSKGENGIEIHDVIDNEAAVA